jgi:hypothetical protein
MEGERGGGRVRDTRQARRAASCGLGCLHGGVASQIRAGPREGMHDGAVGGDGRGARERYLLEIGEGA